jgi:hypothetical protein
MQPIHNGEMTLTLEKLESLFPRAYDSLPPNLKNGDVELGFSNGILWVIDKEEPFIGFYHAIANTWGLTP